jgi:hypothetical protein
MFFECKNEMKWKLNENEMKMKWKWKLNEEKRYKASFLI